MEYITLMPRLQAIVRVCDLTNPTITFVLFALCVWQAGGLLMPHLQAVVQQLGQGDRATNTRFFIIFFL